MLKLINVTKIYRPKKGVPVKALENINITFQSHGMVFILGKSGSGKSTLLNVIGGLDRYDDGEIIIKGKSSLNFSQSDFDSYRNTYLGFIFQEYNILEDFTVGANIGLALELQGKKATNERINAILQQVDLEGFGHRKPNELSGGQKQRVAIARALVKEPDIILADEPTGALDSATGLQVFDTLKKLSRDKLVIVVSHDREFAEMYGDRIIELADGKVLRDIQRIKEPPQSLSTGVKQIDDSIVQIQKGYQLSEDDVERINEYLKAAKEDAFLSVHPEANQQIRRVAQIDEQGYKDTFITTDQAKIIQSMDDLATFKLIKSRFPIRNAIKMGASGLKIKPFRLIITILLSVVAFTLFGLTDTISSYNQVQNTVQSILDSDIDYLSMTKHQKVTFDDDHYYFTRGFMNEQDIARLTSTLGRPFKGVVRLTDTSFHGHLETLSHTAPYYLSQFAGIIEFTEDDLDTFGFSITGRLPETDEEVAITTYIYEHFVAFGYRSLLTDRTIPSSEILSIDHFLSNEPTFYLNGSEYRITGVIDTNFNEERYAPLKQTDLEYHIGYSFLMEELRILVQYSFHSMVFSGPGIIDQLIDRDFVRLNETINVIDENYYWYGAQYLLNAEDNPSQIYRFNQKKNLSEHEVLINIDYLFEKSYPTMVKHSIFDALGISVRPTDIPAGYNEQTYPFSLYVQDALKQAIITYAEEHVETALNHGWQPTNEDPVESFADALMNELFVVNPYLPDGYSGIMIQADQMIEIIEIYQLQDALQQQFQKFTVELSSVDVKNPSALLSIVGFYVPNSSYYEKKFLQPNTDFQVLMVSRELYAKVEASSGGQYVFAIALMPEDERSLQQIVQTLYTQDETADHYVMENEVTYIVRLINSFVESASKVFLYVGLGFCIFASLMLLNFIATSISYKRREIGILRAIGARSKDVFSIFFSESLLIAFINFILSSIATIIIVQLINNMMRNRYGFLLTLFRFGIRQLFLLLLVSTFVAFIGSFFPVYKTARKKPIDAIRNR